MAAHEDLDGTVTSTSRHLSLAAVAAVAALGAYRAFVRPRWSRWGSTPDETARSLPGDDLVTCPYSVTTRSVTITADATQVWPWLVQMGAGRAGWYSYDAIDNGGWRSSEEIVPTLQHVRPGDTMPWLPGATDGFTVLRVDPGRALVLGALPSGGPLVMSWAFVLEESTRGTTRLIVRARVGEGYRAPFGLPSWTLDSVVTLGHWVMQRRQLLGIARRAERWHVRAGAPVAAVTATLDRFMRGPLVRERHETSVHAPADVVYAVVREFDLQSLPAVRAIFWLRAHVMRGEWPHRVPRGFLEETRALGWGVLAEVPDRLYVAGAACQPWKANVTFVPIAPDRFRDYAEPEMVKIAWTMETEPEGPTWTRLATETRVLATDTAARRRFRRYWLAVRAGIVTIRRASLPAIRREAERRWRAQCATASHVTAREAAATPDDAPAMSSW